MKTRFEIFESEYSTYLLKEDIKEYQEKYNLEIKEVLLIKSDDDKVIIGVLFEIRSENENRV